VQHLPAGWLVLDGRFCHGIGIATNGLGECPFVFRPVFILSGEIPSGISVEVLLASVFVACDLGGAPRFAGYSDRTDFSNRSSAGGNGFDDPRLDQNRPLDSQFVVELAGVVSGRDRTAS
jgi:hypothetical protein